MTFWLLAALRIAVSGFCLMTAAYGVLNCSSFAFDMFVRPQLFPWLSTFVAWHHLWLGAAYLASLISLVPQLDWRVRRAGRQKMARWLSIGYAFLFGVVAAWQLLSPALPSLWNDHRALPTTIAALLPLLWLAAIDHLSVEDGILAHENASWQPFGQRQLLVACAASGGYVWLAHVIRAVVGGDLSAGAAAWAMTLAWTLALTAGVFALVYTVCCLIAAVSGLSRAPGTAERYLVIAVAAAGVCEFLRRIVLPTLSLSAFDSWMIAVAAGLALAVSWAGLARRRARVKDGVGPRRTLVAAASALAMPILAFLALRSTERIDWAFVGQRFIVVAAWTLIFALALRATRHAADRSWSKHRMLVPPLAALSALLVVPRAASAVAEWTGDSRIEPTTAFEKHAAADVAFQLVSDLFVSRAGFDQDYYRFLQTNGDFSGRTTVTVPAIELATPWRSRSRRPDIFVFALDSLRRDYLSPYNPAVSFTPHIAELAGDAFVFQNAFTRHGGTELAIPSIWAGAMLVRQVRARGFDRVNAFEKLVNADGYRFLVNDFTIAQNVLPTTPMTRLNPDVPSADTDLCQNLEALTTDLGASADDDRPVFGYFSPMNVHILNTHRGGKRSLDGDYPGFYAPYASRLRRLDACFGRFIAHLKKTNRYDDSIIVFTTDHGDSLGENGHWGHATWLAPEVLRIPLVIKIPAHAKGELTTDLTRIAFSTDIAPTLYALLGHPVREDLGPLFGAPLFVPSESELTVRRRKAFLVTASYGSTYGLLRRNGRYLYVTDLVERRELAYDLARGPVGTEASVDHGVRRVNQREIQAQVSEIGRFFRVTR
jgi:membrane-anchored protein YejM (alkaline phosphatase superfamily)